MSLWGRWTHRGVAPTMSPGERRRVIVTNEAAIMVTVASLLSVAQPDGRCAVALAVALGQAVTYAMVPVVMGLGWARFTPRFFSLSALAWLLAMVLVRGTDSGVHFFLIVVAMGVWHVVGPDEGLFAGAVAALSSFCFMGFVAHGWPTMTGATPEQLAFSRTWNDGMLCVILIGFAAYAFRRTNEAETALDAARARATRSFSTSSPRRSPSA